MSRVFLTRILVVLVSVGIGAAAHAQTPSPEAPAPAPAPATEPLDFTGNVSNAAPEPPAISVPPPTLSVRTATAKPEAPPTPLTFRANSLNLSVLGFLIGFVRLNYERLILPKHGVFAEAIVGPDVLRGFEFVALGGTVGYRFHWQGPKTSAFVGGTLSVTRASGTSPTFTFGDKDFPEFRGSVWTIGIAPHIGKRWLFEPSGVNLTLRVGGGLAYHVTDAWRGSEPKAERNMQRSFGIADGELSVGYSF